MDAFGRERGIHMSENGNGEAAAQQNQQQQVDSSAGQQSVDSAASTNKQSQPAGDSVTLTHAELGQRIDNVVKDRIDKQKAKHDLELQEKDSAYKELESQLAKANEQLAEYQATAERNQLAAKVAKETGLSPAQVALLKGDTEEELTEAAAAFKASMPSMYPEVFEASGGKPTQTREDIKAIKNTEERVALMGKHPDLFQK